jgi:hypothetical protein
MHELETDESQTEFHIYIMYKYNIENRVASQLSLHTCDDLNKSRKGKSEQHHNLVIIIGTVCQLLGFVRRHHAHTKTETTSVIAPLLLSRR